MIDNDWDQILKDVYAAEWYKELTNTVDNLYKTSTVYPEFENIFNAFKLTPYNSVKVVILGQDPYHGEKEAHGLSFSVKEGIKIPPSLKNIFKELKSDLDITKEDGNLESWARQGVLLLNTVLTVEKDKPCSHTNVGWEKFTDTVIEKLNERAAPVIFVLWGEKAKEKEALIKSNNHIVISSSHPSPFSARRSFFGSEVFSKINKALINNGQEPIDFSK